MGGSQAFEWAAAYPAMVERLFTFQSAARTSRHFRLFLKASVRPSSWIPRFGRAFIQAHPSAVCAWQPASMPPGASQAFFRHRLDESALGYATLEDFLVDFWEGWFLKRDANDLLAHLWSGIHADISANDTYQGDLDTALAAITADTIIMPSSSDLYFPPEDAAQEAARIAKAELRILQTPGATLPAKA